MSFDNFINNTHENLARLYVSKLLKDPSLTLLELRDALCDQSMQPYLGEIKVSDLLARTKKTTSNVGVVDQCIEFLKEHPNEYFSALELSEHLNMSSSTYISKSLQESNGKSIRLAMRYRSAGPGRPTPTFRYVQELDPSNS